MIGVDTNVLVRLLTADDPAQHELAVLFFGKCSADDPAYISSIMIAEMCWVLHAKYDFSYDELLQVLSNILDSDDFVVEGRGAWEEMRAANKPSMLADYLIAHSGIVAGCHATVTFDRRAAKHIPSMKLLK